ncbi:myb-like protein X [Chrysoperla carnea]|uniref:myb-like protein X n=1 Tax=Chrysoperla carnea TaxID=189513 RepID=UPI001D07863F|nr:myb-like protein X [Chrysoperla carnea]
MFIKSSLMFLVLSCVYFQFCLSQILEDNSDEIGGRRISSSDNFSVVRGVLSIFQTAFQLFREGISETFRFSLNDPNQGFFSGIRNCFRIIFSMVRHIFEGILSIGKSLPSYLDTAAQITNVLINNSTPIRRDRSSFSNNVGNRKSASEIFFKQNNQTSDERVNHSQPDIEEFDDFESNGDDDDERLSENLKALASKDSKNYEIMKQNSASRHTFNHLQPDIEKFDNFESNEDDDDEKLADNLKALASKDSKNDEILKQNSASRSTLNHLQPEIEESYDLESNEDDSDKRLAHNLRSLASEDSENLEIMKQNSASRPTLNHLQPEIEESDDLESNEDDNNEILAENLRSLASEDSENVEIMKQNSASRSTLNHLQPEIEESDDLESNEDDNNQRLTDNFKALASKDSKNVEFMKQNSASRPTLNHLQPEIEESDDLERNKDDKNERLADNLRSLASEDSENVENMKQNSASRPTLNHLQPEIEESDELESNEDDSDERLADNLKALASKDSSKSIESDAIFSSRRSTNIVKVQKQQESQQSKLESSEESSEIENNIYEFFEKLLGVNVNKSLENDPNSEQSSIYTEKYPNTLNLLDFVPNKNGDINMEQDINSNKQFDEDDSDEYVFGGNQNYDDIVTSKYPEFTSKQSQDSKKVENSKSEISHKPVYDSNTKKNEDLVGYRTSGGEDQNTTSKGSKKITIKSKTKSSNNDIKLNCTTKKCASKDTDKWEKNDFKPINGKDFTDNLKNKRSVQRSKVHVKPDKQKSIKHVNPKNILDFLDSVSNESSVSNVDYDVDGINKIKVKNGNKNNKTNLHAVSKENINLDEYETSTEVAIKSSTQSDKNTKMIDADFININEYRTGKHQKVDIKRSSFKNNPKSTKQHNDNSKQLTTPIVNILKSKSIDKSKSNLDTNKHFDQSESDENDFSSNDHVTVKNQHNSNSKQSNTPIVNILKSKSIDKSKFNLDTNKHFLQSESDEDDFISNETVTVKKQHNSSSKQPTTAILNILKSKSIDQRKSNHNTYQHSDQSESDEDEFSSNENHIVNVTTSSVTLGRPENNIKVNPFENETRTADIPVINSKQIKLDDEYHPSREEFPNYSTKSAKELKERETISYIATTQSYGNMKSPELETDESDEYRTDSKVNRNSKQTTDDISTSIRRSKNNIIVKQPGYDTDSKNIYDDNLKIRIDISRTDKNRKKYIHSDNNDTDQNEGNKAAFKRSNQNIDLDEYRTGIYKKENNNLVKKPETFHNLKNIGKQEPKHTHHFLTKRQDENGNYENYVATLAPPTYNNHAIGDEYEKENLDNNFRSEGDIQDATATRDKFRERPDFLILDHF